MSDFNRIAPFYDNLKKAVFRGTLDKASSYFIHQIPDNSNILILGGGSGKLLLSFNSTHIITYIEPSDRMMALAKSRKCQAKVEFINSSIEAFSAPHLYNVVITPFILDCFTENQLAKIFDKLAQYLKKGGFWLHTDFYPQNNFQRRFTSLMYYFFRLSTGMKAQKVPNFDKYFQSPIFIEEKKALFLNAMVHSYIYRKIDS